jgi:zinc transport system ATP-binding protein
MAKSKKKQQRPDEPATEAAIETESETETESATESESESATESESQSVALEARRLSVSRDRKSLLENIDLQVFRGSIHAIIGPNGAGKSTLLAALMGHTSFTGSVKHTLIGDGVVGFVPQTFVVDRTLPVTAFEFLALSRQRHPICLGVSRAVRRTAGELLERVGLPGFGPRRLSTLSGGELQRVLLANALDPRPELLFLDEPSGGLDQSSMMRLEDLLLQLKGHHTTTILVSHDSGQVKRLADNVTWIDRGVRASGTTSEVFGDSPYFPFMERGK